LYKTNLNHPTEAAIDANAPLEDEDDANAGPIDSDEETAAVMTALSRWNPRPVIDQPILMPIRRAYQLARLREQLDNATNCGTVNIFKVVSKNGEPLRDVNGTILGNGLDGEDAPGEPDFGAGSSSMTMGGGAGGPSRKSSSASTIQPSSAVSQAQRKASVVSNRP
jgi:SAGA-associated factor 73